MSVSFRLSALVVHSVAMAAIGLDLVVEPDELVVHVLHHRVVVEGHVERVEARKIANGAQHDAAARLGDGSRGGCHGRGGGAEVATTGAVVGGGGSPVGTASAERRTPPKRNHRGPGVPALTNSLRLIPRDF